MTSVGQSVDIISSDAFREVRSVERGATYETAKLVLDLLIGSIGLVLSLPVVTVLAILIRLDSPGPIIFSQARVGRGGRLFTFYKFRTMYNDARERYPELYRYAYDAETIRTMRFKILDDPRLTPIGRWLRRTSLDEIPNLWNVLRGELSVVGPRPEIPEMLRYYERWQLQKFTVKPGVTGYSQTSGRGLLPLQATIAEDVRYVRERSFLVDLKVMLVTCKEVVRRSGAF
jgi:lipopolysaccharide/colanic/teichoic acid biosynthesis glycosyltransferase